MSNARFELLIDIVAQQNLDGFTACRDERMERDAVAQSRGRSGSGARRRMLPLSSVENVTDVSSMNPVNKVWDRAAFANRMPITWTLTTSPAFESALPHTHSYMQQASHRYRWWCVRARCFQDACRMISA